MQEVGFQLYTDMLRAAVSALKAGREPDLTEPLGVTTEINLHVPALLPASYCSDVHERLVLYKRLASVETSEELEGIQEELVDRFGPAPSRRRRCSRAIGCGSRRKPLGVTKVDAGPERTHDPVRRRIRRSIRAS